MKTLGIILKLYIFSIVPIGTISYGKDYIEHSLVSGIFIIGIGFIFLIFAVIEAFHNKQGVE